MLHHPHASRFRGIDFCRRYNTQDGREATPSHRYFAMNYDIAKFRLTPAIKGDAKREYKSYYYTDLNPISKFDLCYYTRGYRDGDVINVEW